MVRNEESGAIEKEEGVGWRAWGVRLGLRLRRWGIVGENGNGGEGKIVYILIGLYTPRQIYVYKPTSSYICVIMKFLIIIR